MVVVHEDGRLIGVAPWHEDRTRTGLRVARLLGTGHRVEPLAEPGREPEVAREVAACLASLADGPGALSLDRVDARSPWPLLLARESPGGGRVAGRELTPAPVVRLEGTTFDAWLASRSRNFRDQRAQARRRIERAGGVIRLAAEPAEVNAAIEAFVGLTADRWANGAWGGPPRGGGVAAMLREAAAEMVPAGRMRIWQLDVDGETASVQVFLAADGELGLLERGLRRPLVAAAPRLRDHRARHRARLRPGRPPPRPRRRGDGLQAPPRRRRRAAGVGDGPAGRRAPAGAARGAAAAAAARPARGARGPAPAGRGQRSGFAAFVADRLGGAAGPQPAQAGLDVRAGGAAAPCARGRAGGAAPSPGASAGSRAPAAGWSPRRPGPAGRRAAACSAARPRRSRGAGRRGRSSPRSPGRRAPSSAAPGSSRAPRRRSRPSPRRPRRTRGGWRRRAPRPRWRRGAGGRDASRLPPASRSIARASGCQSRERSPQRRSCREPKASIARSSAGVSSARVTTPSRFSIRFAVRRTSRRALWLRPASHASQLPARMVTAWPGMRNSRSRRAWPAPGHARATARGQAAFASTRSRLTRAGRGCERPSARATCTQTAASCPGPPGCRPAGAARGSRTGAGPPAPGGRRAPGRARARPGARPRGRSPRAAPRRAAACGATRPSAGPASSRAGRTRPRARPTRPRRRRGPPRRRGGRRSASRPSLVACQAPSRAAGAASPRAARWGRVPGGATR